MAGKGVSDDKKADLWVQHNLLMWRSVYATPVVGVTVFAGWYSLAIKDQIFLANAVLVAGILVMAIQWLIIRRIAQYTIALVRSIGTQIASVPPAPLGLNGVTVAMAVPIVIGLLFVVMLVFGDQTLAAGRGTTQDTHQVPESSG